MAQSYFGSFSINYAKANKNWHRYTHKANNKNIKEKGK
jgi:hypothetical protein